MRTAIAFLTLIVLPSIYGCAHQAPTPIVAVMAKPTLESGAYRLDVTTEDRRDLMMTVLYSGTDGVMHGKNVLCSLWDSDSLERRCFTAGLPPVTSLSFVLMLRDEGGHTEHFFGSLIKASRIDPETRQVYEGLELKRHLVADFKEPSAGGCSSWSVVIPRQPGGALTASRD